MSTIVARYDCGKHRPGNVPFDHGYSAMLPDSHSPRYTLPGHVGMTCDDLVLQRMDLVGGDMGSIPGGVHTNITFIFPTIVSTMTGGGDTYERGVALVLPFLSRANQRPIPINMASQLSLTDKTPLYKGFN
uniref:Uncharacterized protein n=1 Tax=Timema poppense TaxID=170557 RepID=A0A7R9HG61_TIMPO|nr:unnamed protein product [Timema poppensis]